MQLTLTYGQMPSREEFDAAWEFTEIMLGFARDRHFSFGNDKRLGDASLTQDELWDELLKAHDEYNTLLEGDIYRDPEVVGSWISDVLYTLGIEWV